jgi:hypothetical protein
LIEMIIVRLFADGAADRPAFGAGRTTGSRQARPARLGIGNPQGGVQVSFLKAL